MSWNDPGSSVEVHEPDADDGSRSSPPPDEALATPLPAPDPDLLREASACRSKALDAFRLGDFDEAAAHASQAAEQFDGLEMSLAAARVLRLQADCLLAGSRAAEARDVIGAAIERFAASPKATEADRAGCDAALGGAYRQLGKFAEATSTLGRAAGLFSEAGMPARAAICRLGQGVVLHAAGDEATSVAMLTAVRDVLVRSRRPDAVAVCEFDLGVVLHDIGSMDDAIEYLQQARVTFSSLDRPADVAGCNQNLAVAMHAMGRDVEARQRLMNARAGYSRLGRDRDVAQCDHNLSVVHRSLGDEAEADRLEAQAIEIEHQLVDGVDGGGAGAPPVSPGP